MRRLLLIVVIGLGIAATSWFAAMAVADWQLRSQLRAVQREITARRIDEARTRLTRLAERWPGRGDVAYWMGACEMILPYITTTPPWRHGAGFRPKPAKLSSRRCHAPGWRPRSAAIDSPKRVCNPPSPRAATSAKRHGGSW